MALVACCYCVLVVSWEISSSCQLRIHQKSQMFLPLAHINPSKVFCNSVGLGRSSSMPMTVPLQPIQLAIIQGLAVSTSLATCATQSFQCVPQIYLLGSVQQYADKVCYHLGLGSSSMSVTLHCSQSSLLSSRVWKCLCSKISSCVWLCGLSSEILLCLGKCQLILPPTQTNPSCAPQLCRPGFVQHHAHDNPIAADAVCCPPGCGSA